MQEWLLNNEVVITYTIRNTAGSVFSGPLKYNYSYFSSLILFRNSDDIKEFVSSLIISTTRDVMFNITCSNAIAFSRATNHNLAYRRRKSLNAFDSNGLVHLQFLAADSTSIPTKTIYFYICRINGTDIHWQTTAQIFGFNTNYVGNDETFTSRDHTMITQQIIMMEFSSYSVVSLLIVTDSNVDVTCLTSSHSAELSFRDVSSAIQENMNDGTVSTASVVKSKFVFLCLSLSLVLEIINVP